MPRSRHYSPEIRRFLVSVLFHEARGRGVPMTVLTNRILQDGLKATQGWKKAEEATQIQETPPPYQTK